MFSSSKISRQNTRYIATIYLLLIAIAELITAYNPQLGITFHIALIFALLFHGALSEEPLSYFLASLLLAPIIRVLSLAMPLSYFSYNAWFLVVGICVLVATLFCIHIQDLKPREVGLKIPELRKMPWEVAVIIVAIPTGFAEYFILKPQPIIYTDLTTLLTSSIVLIIFTGFLEELVFRGLIQHNAKKALGRMGIPFVVLLFGALHIGNLSILDVILAGSVGAIYSLVVEKTGSIYGVTTSHGLINIILFLVAPSIL